MIISTLIVLALLRYIQIIFKLEVWKLILGLHTPTHSHNMSKYHQYENHITDFVVVSPLHISFLHFFRSFFLRLHPLICILWVLHILCSHYLIFLSLLYCCFDFAPSPLCIFTIFFSFLCWLQTNFSCKLVSYFSFPCSIIMSILKFLLHTNSQWMKKKLDTIVTISCVTFLLKILGQNTVGIPKRIGSFCIKWTPSLKTCCKILHIHIEGLIFFMDRYITKVLLFA
jgi:hypothetical protein